MRSQAGTLASAGEIILLVDLEFEMIQVVMLYVNWMSIEYVWYGFKDVYVCI